MHQDDLLQNKYDRLCVEYNKLRTKHKDLKDTLNTYIATSKKLETTLEEKEKRIKHLEEECEALLLKSRPTSKSFETSDVTNPENPVQDSRVNKHDSQSDQANTITEASHQDTGLTTEKLGQLIFTFTKALDEWTAAIKSGQNPPDSKEVENRLLERISQLERQVCDLSLQRQMERRRRLMLDKERSSTLPKELPAGNGDNPESVPITEPPESESLMLDWMQERIYEMSYQAQYFASRAAFLQDELLCLVPHITLLAEEALHYRSKNETSREALQQLQEELNTAHLSAIRQSSQMAEHIANLTEELQAFRGQTFPSANQTECSSRAIVQQSGISSTKKGSIFSVLKR